MFIQYNGNKLYWSPQKIENQVFKGRDYNTHEGQEAIYQLGLMLIDLVYDI